MDKSATSKLTGKQHETYTILQKYIRERGKSPTLKELAGLLNVRSVQTVAERIESLRKKGLVLKRRHSWRGVELVEYATDDPHRLVSIPLAGSVGADNLAVFAQEEYGQFIQVEAKALPDLREVVAIQARGGSMTEAGINDGDYVLVEPLEVAEIKNGELVVANVGDKAVVKRIQKGREHVQLNPESSNPEHQPIILSNDSEDFRIMGRVVDVLSFGNSSDNEVRIEPLEE